MKLRRRRRKKLACTYASHPTPLGKLWHFLWHEDSWASFLADAILIVLIGNFILYPGVGLLMGTDYPGVAVVSGSMDHHSQDFDAWWGEHKNQYASYNISTTDFDDYSFRNGFSKGDILIVIGEDEYDVGDVIVYTTPLRAYPIIHRVVGKNWTAGEGAAITTYSTKGDANSGQLGFETNIEPSQIHGRAVFKVPYLGWLKVKAVELFN